MPVLGKRSNQRGLFEADTVYLDFVGPDTFYGFLARERGRLFRDEDFADLYCHTNGRSSVPPSLLATAPVLQAYERVTEALGYSAYFDYDPAGRQTVQIAPDGAPTYFEYDAVSRQTAVTDALDNSGQPLAGS